MKNIEKKFLVNKILKLSCQYFFRDPKFNVRFLEVYLFIVRYARRLDFFYIFIYTVESLI